MNFITPRKIIILIIALIFLLWLFFARSGVVIYKVKAIDTIKGVTASGTIRSDNTIELMPSVTSEIKELLVKEGDFVKKGQVIAILERKDIYGQLEQAQGNMQATIGRYAPVNGRLSIPELEIKISKAEIKDAIADMNSLKNQLEEEKIYLKDALSVEKRYNILYKEGALSMREYEDSLFKREEVEKRINKLKNLVSGAKARIDAKKSELKINQNNLTVASGEMTSAKGLLNEAEGFLGRYELRAPVDGYITNTVRTKGNMASSLSTVVEIVNPKSIYLKAEVEETSILDLKENQKVLMVFDAYPDKIINGYVYKVIRRVDPITGIFIVKIRFNQQKQTPILPGMSVDSTILVKEYKNALIIPTDFLIEEKSKFFVLKKYGPFAIKKEVEIEYFDNNKSLVKKGLKPNESILKSFDNRKIKSYSLIKIKERMKELK